MFIGKLNISFEGPHFTATVNILYFQTRQTAGLQYHGVWRQPPDLETHSGHWEEAPVWEPAERCHLVSWWKYQEFVDHAHSLRDFLSLSACLFNWYPRHTLWKEALVSNVSSTADEWSLWVVAEYCGCHASCLRASRIQFRPKVWTFFMVSLSCYR